MKDEPERPYPEGVAFDEARRQRQRADKAEALLRRALKSQSRMGNLWMSTVSGQLWLIEVKEICGE